MIPEQAQLLVSHLDWAATILGDEDLVANLHAGLNPLSVLVVCSRANCNDLGLVQLLDGGLGEEDAGCGLGFWLETLHKNAVEEGRNGADGLDGRLLLSVSVKLGRSYAAGIGGRMGNV